MEVNLTADPGVHRIISDINTGKTTMYKVGMKEQLVDRQNMMNQISKVVNKTISPGYYHNKVDITV